LFFCFPRLRRLLKAPSFSAVLRMLPLTQAKLAAGFRVAVIRKMQIIEKAQKKGQINL